jgi:predicted RNA binding protein YcfA (HicA-like mRNA interferase family)
MPRKVRELKADLRKAGFRMRPGKGSHTVWEHPLIPENPVTVSGNDGDDAGRYQERDVRDARRKLRKAQQGR